jgi:hypothetical protein
MCFHEIQVCTFKVEISKSAANWPTLPLDTSGIISEHSFILFSIETPPLGMNLTWTLKTDPLHQTQLIKPKQISNHHFFPRRRRPVKFID